MAKQQKKIKPMVAIKKAISKVKPKPKKGKC
jgi:hypothetical protein